MKKTLTAWATLVLTTLSANAQTGHPYIHDPSTLAECEGK